MGFASTYLEDRALFPEIIKEAPDNQTGIIVVVPACSEPGICRLLDSLKLCSEPDCKVEVLVIVNAPGGAGEEVLENNRLTLKNIESWQRQNKNCFFRLFAFFTPEPVLTGWGVGMARKSVMDEAVRRFDSINNPDGVILNIDADCLVEKNYFVSVCNELYKKNSRSACSIYFEHPLSGAEFSPDIYRYIALYELHLRYYYQGLAYSGFPFVFHTVGSALAVKALPYVKAGGMNRRQAGEDFYFIQKMVQAGGYFTLNSTTVFPSPRVSTRVPFGTGASVGKLSMDMSRTLMTYNVNAFKELRHFFGMTDTFYSCSPEDLAGFYKSLPFGLRTFIDEMEWFGKMPEIKNNTSGSASFKKRFFGWFNMFKIVKYLNFVHIELYEKKAVEVSASELLETEGVNLKSMELVDLLIFFRKLEKHG